MGRKNIDHLAVPCEFKVGDPNQNKIEYQHSRTEGHRSGIMTLLATDSPFVCLS